MAKIGFEIHVQLKTKEKLFCNCSSDYEDKEPNTNICPICLGLPGIKPLPPNIEAIKGLIRVGLILGCKINKKKIHFLRKHYFYPDLPKNYQITSEPFMVDGNFFGVRIREIHLEEDPGRYDLRNGYVDFNRSGIPLAEIVTEPDLTNAEEAKEWLEKLFMYLKYSNAIKGNIRVDVNISLEGNERVEVKNVNSIDGVYRAIKYEILRQSKLISMGKKIKRETRHYDEEKKITIPLREKETLEDYRYMPEPDLLPLDYKILESIEREVKKDLLIPSEIEYKLINEYKIEKGYVYKLMLDPKYLVFSLKILEKLRDKINKKVLEFLTNYFWKIYQENKEVLNLDINELTKYILDFSNHFDNLYKDKIEDIIKYSINNKDFDLIGVAKKLNSYMVMEVNEEVIYKKIEEILKKEKGLLEGIQKNKKAVGKIIGLIIKEYGNKVNPKEVSKIVKKYLKEKFNIEV